MGINNYTEKVDYNIPVDAAQIGFDMGIEYFAVVSSIGADENEFNFYLKLKGEMEKEVSQFAIPQNWNQDPQCC